MSAAIEDTFLLFVDNYGGSILFEQQGVKP